jgi:hypothetical protein
MSIGRSIQEPATAGELESVLTNGGDDPLFVFAVVAMVCVGVFFVGRHLLRGEVQREARARRTRAKP